MKRCRILFVIIAMLLSISSCEKAKKEDMAAAGSFTEEAVQESPGKEEPEKKEEKEEQEEAQELPAEEEEKKEEEREEKKEEAEPESRTEEADSKADGSGSVTITMVDVGQGLCIVAESDGEYMVYDGGDREHSSYVVSYFKKKGIEDIKLLVASHYDEDHIAGLVGLLNTVHVEKTVVPDYEGDTKIYFSFMDACTRADEQKYARTGDIYPFGSAYAEILYACDGTEASENDMSTVVRIICGDPVCIITGDAEGYEEDILLKESLDKLSCPLYIAGHHGSASSSKRKFVEAISPSYAFISVGEGNDYGHPSQKTLDTFTACGVKTYRSDLNGEVSLRCDNGENTIICEREDVQEKSASDAKEEQTGARYILNTSSMKFHYPDCESVGKMADHNKEETDKTREELLQEGYSPCGNCRP